MKSVKIIAVAALALSAAACQTTNQNYTDITQQTYASVHPNVPSNWIRSVSPTTGSIVYACSIQRCDEPGVITYRARAYVRDEEMLVRRKIITASLLQEMSKSWSHATNGRIQAGNVRDMTNRNSAGFEMTMSFQTTRGTAYAIARSRATGHEIRVISAAGMTPAKARQILQTGLQGAQ